MRPFSLLVKPSSWGCNLRCKYCFYLEKRAIYADKHHKMTNDVLEAMIRKFMAVNMSAHSIGWQGGEPTTMGLDFFKQAVKFQQQYGKSGQTVSNGLQTNGTLLDDEWCKFLTKYNFLVGISIDGPAKIHDINRVTVDGRGSHELVMKGLAALRRNHTEHNVLTLVSSVNQDRPLEIYNYLKDLGVSFHQYIECVEFNRETGQLTDFAVQPEKWGEFLCQIFDEWYKEDTRKISVRLFDSVLTMLVDRVPNVCAMGQDCRQYFVVENNGDIYPCDFFVQPELKLGNIVTDDWEALQNSPIYEEFGRHKREWNEECESCRFLPLCAGCCPKNRPIHGSDPRALSVLCSAWKMFYEHTIDRFEKLAADIVKERQEEAMRQRMATSPRNYARVGRNDPCPCGSGKKYKKCCGK